MPSELDPRTWLSTEGHRPADRDWVRLYLLALAVLIPTAIFQLFTVYLLTLLLTLIANGHGDFALANTLPWIVVGGYFGSATSALIHPLGAGRHFADAIGARRATTEETAAYQDAMSSLPLDRVKRLPRWLYVLDRHELNAAVLGDALVINRTVFDSEFLPAVIAHELGHLNSMDARVSCAANRLASLASLTEPWRTATPSKNDGPGLGELVAPTRIRSRRLRRPTGTRRRARQILRRERAPLRRPHPLRLDDNRDPPADGLTHRTPTRMSRAPEPVDGQLASVGRAPGYAVTRPAFGALAGGRNQAPIAAEHIRVIVDELPA
jgi:hypothetical protein